MSRDETTVRIRDDVAIVGMACMFPDAPNLHAYWRNIATGVDAIADVPAGRWDEDPFYDPDTADDDRVYSKRGGYLPTEIPFDPLAHGIMPVAVAGGEVDQFLVLQLVSDALADAGYAAGLPDGERTEFVLGRGNYLGPGNSNLFQRSVGIEQALRVLRAVHPEHTEEELEAIRRDLRASLPNFGPELGPTHIPNVVTGRAANRLDFMGGNYTVDAACASSLIAIETAIEDLRCGKCDLAIAGGSHTFTCVPLLMVFCTLNALSRRSEIRPFDENADGTLPGEGVGIVVLKRLADAERDGDRIYAVVKGAGSASDGRALSVMAPRLEGEVLALRRAYERAGVDPRTVGLIEAHGTATTVGDATEMQALKTVFGPRRGETPSTAVGTVKSMIGHAMPASGVAGVIKMALALYHKTLPPTLHCETPSARLGLDESPFYMNTATRPWINAADRAPRRAGVNAFGFGGINAHVVLEEHGGERDDAPDLLPWDSELMLLGGATRAGMVESVERLRDYLAARPEAALADVAFTLSRRFERPACRLAIVAASRDDLEKKLARALKLLANPDCVQIKDPRGIYYFARPLAGTGKIAFLFPGEGSQRLDMLAQLCLHFPEVRAVFDAADRAILAQGRDDPISADVFPPPAHSAEQQQSAEQRLWRIDRQCEAIMTANRAMLTLFTHLGIEPDMMTGHSIGEWSSITAGGITPYEPPVAALRSLDAMVKALDDDPAIPEAALLAVSTNRAVAQDIIDGVEGAYVALDNCPHQVVLGVALEAVDTVAERLRQRGVGFERSRFNRGSHTPLFAGFLTLARRHFKNVEIGAPRVDVYSCCTAAPLPRTAAGIRRLLVQSWERPVEFRRTVEAMYEAGARIFVEVGPRGVLSAFTDDVLRGKGALTLAVDLPKWSELTGLNHLAAMLTAQGFDLNIPYLYQRRPLRELALDAERDAPADPHDGRPVVMLNLGVPMMSLSDETLARLKQSRNGGTGVGSAAPVPGSAGVPVPGSAGVPPVPAGRPSPNGEGVMAHYMQTMQGFLRAEQRVLETLLRDAPAPRAGGPSRLGTLANGAHRADPRACGMRTVDPRARPIMAARPAGPDDQRGPLPLLGEIVTLTPGQALVARRRITPDEDLYLHDHTFGGAMSVTDATLEPLTVAPLTISLEMMAEAATLVLPGLLLTGMADVRAHRWVQVDESAPTILEIAARRLDGPEQRVRVEVRELDAHGAPDAMVIEGTMIFGTTYPAASTPRPVALVKPLPTFKTARQMYDEMWMFHGPLFQGVSSLDQSGENGIQGTLEVLPTARLFRSTERPRLLTDVALLDAAGQLLGYWAKERLTSSFVVFPVRVESLHIYGPNLAAGTRVACHVHVTEMMPQTVKVDMEIFDPYGRLWMRVCGWQDWRFHIVGDVYDFWRFPLATIMSKPLPAPLPRELNRDAYTCYRMDTLVGLGQTMVTKCLAYMALNHAERRVYHSLRGPTIRQIEWLAGRIAAKDAVRTYLRQRHGLRVGPADVEIGADEYGRPIALGAWVRQVGEAPCLSLAHSDGLGIALAGPPGGVGVGIDVQGISPRSEEFDRIAFAPEELSLLYQADGSARDERRIRFWCAKEAVAKALGRGLIEGPRSVAVETWNDATGTAGVGLRGALAAAFPHLAPRRLAAHTLRDGDYVVATSFGLPAGHVD